MAVTMALASKLDGLYTDISLDGLTVGQYTDIYRLQIRYVGDDPDTGEPQYDRETPDRSALWSAVGSWIRWKPTAATAEIRDYESPTRPCRYFVVPSESGGPLVWDYAAGDYPTSRGVLSDIVHFDRMLAEADEAAPLVVGTGDLVLRSTAELAVWGAFCLVEMDGPKYTARGTEMAVLGQQYPVWVGDTREARRGSLTLLARDLAQYDLLRRIVFPSSGRISPFIVNASGDPVLLLDDMRCLPLDISVEQSTQRDANKRYVRLDYVEVDPRTPLLSRSGDNPDPAKPVASFTMSDYTPAKSQTITFTDTSTGAYLHREWTSYAANGTTVIGARYDVASWKGAFGRGVRTVRLRVSGLAAGASVSSRKFTVT